jgi:NitT/TauT family transport system substrate-binding protein
MRKIIISTIILVGIMVTAFSLVYKYTKKSNLTTIKLAEVTHSIFYAPQYVAISEGFFEEEKLEIDLILTPGADKVMAAVLSGDVDIGFSGPEATIYVYNGGEKDYVVTFAQLTKRDGSFIVSRKKINNFTLDDLKGKYVISGRKGGMPEMTFEWALKQHGIDPKKDLFIDTSVDFAAMQGAFIGGTGDFVTLFEPVALQLEKQQFGYVVASVGALSGETPYTAYNARKSYIKENPEIIQSFTNAINKGLKFVAENNAETIAKSIYEFFPDMSMNDLIAVTQRYKDQDTWNDNTYLKEEAFNRLQEIMINAGELTKKAPYANLVDNSFSK